MKIEMLSVPSDMIRSSQIGDWRFGKHQIVAYVDMELPPESQLAIAIHEVIEAWLCRRAAVSDDEVVAFDEQYESERKEGKHGPNDEPGDDPAAPYRAQHMAATHVERAVCAALGISWQWHELYVQRLGEDLPKTESPGLLPAGSPEPPPQHVLD